MKIYRGKLTPGHKQDTFRELLSMWEESELCEVIDGAHDSVFCWANNINEILLYEYPRFDLYPGLPSFWYGALFGNSQREQLQGQRVSPWIFWSRHPRSLENKIINSGVKSYDAREIESIFLGKIENQIQHARRTDKNWSNAISFFNMPVRLGDTLSYEYSQDEYLDLISKSKFGLSLPGYGPKCNREIEYMGLGVVPILVPGVCTSYYNKIEKNKHYFLANDPDEIEAIIKNCSRNQWEDMSANCVEWYERNCSRSGSFATTMEIIERLY